MIDSSKIAEILNDSPSVSILKLQNRELIITFLATTFSNQPGAILSDKIHNQLSDYLDAIQIECDEDSEILLSDNYETKAKKFIHNWTNKGFLTNYDDEAGDVYYELSSHSSKTLDWLSSLKKEEYVGAESKFRNIFNQLKELVEFTNEDAEKRIQILEDRKLEIEKQIQRMRGGEDVEVFQDFEIVPRFNQLTQSAKELLSDFKEVEDNFIEITRDIYQKHADGNLAKSSILEFTFDAIDELKNSSQGKSFYAFYNFILTPDLQEEWGNLTKELYETLEKKEIEITDFFLKKMKKNLHSSGQKVSKANDKMAEKLSRIIRENENLKSEATKYIIQDIKKCLIKLSKARVRPDISIELETAFNISIPFERKLTFEQSEELIFKEKPQLADENISHSKHLNKLFKLSTIDKEILRRRIEEVLNTRSQTTIAEIIENYGGIEKGLPELFGYITIAKEFKHSINPDKIQRIEFDIENKKSIQIPEIILTK